MLRQDVFFQKDKLNIVISTAFKYFVIFAILLKICKIQNWQKVFGKKNRKVYIPAKYKVPYFFWSICRNREKISLAYTFVYFLYKLIATIPLSAIY